MTYLTSRLMNFATGSNTRQRRLSAHGASASAATTPETRATARTVCALRLIAVPRPLARREGVMGNFDESEVMDAATCRQALALLVDALGDFEGMDDPPQGFSPKLDRLRVAFRMGRDALRSSGLACEVVQTGASQ